MSVQSRASRAAGTQNRSMPAPPSPLARAGMASGGQALDKHTQASMSAKFGHDFSSVRIHTDGKAGDSAAALGADAYAHGSDVVFGAGKYQPGSPETERMLAHELTHVVQQSQSGPGDPARASRKDDASEREADSAAGQVLSGESVAVQAAPQAAVARISDATRDYGLNMGATFGSFLPGPLGLLAGAFGGEESIRGMPGADDPLRTMKQVEGLAGFGNSVLGTAAYFGGFDSLGALGGSAASVTGAGLEGAAALGPGALVAGAGLAGLATGHYLYENTEVGEDSQDALGGIDSLLGGTPGHSKLVDMDDRRKELWDEGGAWNDTKAIGYGIGEGAVATAGAIGGLGKGAYHGVKSLAGKAWDALTDNPWEDAMREIELQQGTEQVTADLEKSMDAQDMAEESAALYGTGNVTAHDDPPPPPR